MKFKPEHRLSPHRSTFNPPTTFISILQQSASRAAHHQAPVPLSALSIGFSALEQNIRRTCRFKVSHKRPSRRPRRWIRNRLMPRPTAGRDSNAHSRLMILSMGVIMVCLLSFGLVELLARQIVCSRDAVCAIWRSLANVLMLQVPVLRYVTCTCTSRSRGRAYTLRSD